VLLPEVDARGFVERLQIEKRGEVGYTWLWPWFDEQEPLWEALSTRRKVLAIKPRRVGYTTLVSAFLFQKAYRARRGRKVLQVAHDPDSLETLRYLVEGFHDTLPLELQVGYETRNNRTTVFGNNCTFERRLSGQRGKVRGKGLHDVHFTEAAFYATRETGSVASDEETFASGLAALDADDAHIVVESTGNGPNGLFHRLYRTAKDDPEWGLVFVPWTWCKRYQRPPPPNFIDDLDRAERQLLEQGVTLPQLAWRRQKLTTDGFSLLRFRREYPLTDAEPFLLDEAGWFDAEPLNLALLLLGNQVEDPKAQYLVFIPPEPGRKYFQGVDTSGGTGRDFAVGSVWRDDLVQVAVWRSNRMSPHDQAEMAVQVSAQYNRALTLIEANRFGHQVIARAEQLGLNAWKDEKGEDFYTHGGWRMSKKWEIYSDARQLVAQDLPTFRHATTVRELLSIIEKPNGKLEAQGDAHDDCADAAVLAWHAARNHVSRPGTFNVERERMLVMQRRRQAARNGSLR